MRKGGRVVLLVGLWLLAWGEFSLANVLSGIAVAVGLLAAFPPIRVARHDVHPSPAGIARATDCGRISRIAVMVCVCVVSISSRR